MILGPNLVFVRESRKIFRLIRKVLENHDLGKFHKNLENLYCSLKFVLAGTPMHLGPT